MLFSDIKNSKKYLKLFVGILKMIKLKSVVKRYYFGFKSIFSPFLQLYPAGHFYSVIPNLSEVEANKDLLFRHSDNLEGIDLCETEQLNMLGKLSCYYSDLPFSETPQTSTNRYYFQNEYFSYSDAIILHTMLRHFQPKQVIEIGSGFSSAVMLDTKDLFLHNSTNFKFIEPYPDRLLNLMNEEDKSQNSLIIKPVQEVEIELFTQLNTGDFLFIDSSHVVKIGSDVLQIIFNILPRLKSGVIVHFHDIFYPFEYPYKWIKAGRAWNEAYFLRAFLQFNNKFKILYFNSFMGLVHKESLEQKMPLCLKNIGGSLWLKKID